MKVFLVVGMHRSATSLVAKGLHHAGVDMGESLLPANPTNPHGHYEDLPAVHLNDAILEAAGGSWDRPPTSEAVRAVGGAGVAAYVDRRGRTGGMWGVKDPRLSLTWPVWLPHLPGDLHVIWVRRSRGEVARSLHERDGTPVDVGLRLAEVSEQSLTRLMATLCDQ